MLCTARTWSWQQGQALLATARRPELMLEGSLKQEASISQHLSVCIPVHLFLCLSHPVFFLSFFFFSLLFLWPTVTSHIARATGNSQVLKCNLEHLVLFVCLHLLYSSQIHCSFHLSKVPSLFLHPAPFSLPPCAISPFTGYIFASLLFFFFFFVLVPHAPQLFNVFPLMTIKQGKVQVPTLCGTRINLQ